MQLNAAEIKMEAESNMCVSPQFMPLALINNAVGAILISLCTWTDQWLPSKDIW